MCVYRIQDVCACVGYIYIYTYYIYYIHILYIYMHAFVYTHIYIHIHIHIHIHMYRVCFDASTVTGVHESNHQNSCSARPLNLPAEDDVQKPPEHRTTSTAKGFSIDRGLYLRRVSCQNQPGPADGCSWGTGGCTDCLSISEISKNHLNMHIFIYIQFNQ